MKTAFIIGTGVCLLVFSVRPGTAQIEEPTTRTYRVQHHVMEDFLPLVSALLSAKGAITQSNINVLVVKDFPTNLALVDSLFTQYDTPLKEVQVQIYLVKVRMVEDPAGLSGLSQELELLMKQMQDFNEYEIIDQGLITAEEGAFTTLNVAAGDFIISFKISYLEDNSTLVKLRNFILQERTKDVRGPVVKNLLETSTNLPDGIPTIISAAKHGRQGKTLFLIATATIQET